MTLSKRLIKEIYRSVCFRLKGMSAARVCLYTAAALLLKIYLKKMMRQKDNKTLRLPLRKV